MKTRGSLMFGMAMVSFVLFFAGCQKPDNKNAYTYVDLGLPSGTLWATCNVGAESPEEYGDFFAWGETATKDTYNWSTYKYCRGREDQLTKYCCFNAAIGYVYGYHGYSDDLTILQPEDDVATMNWGDEWRMPTYEEGMELCQNTTSTWVTRNGIKGMLFTGSNGNSLFILAAGCKTDDKLFFVGECGYYWLSSLHATVPSIAWFISFNTRSCGNNCYSRYYGMSVRPVRAAGKN